MKTLKFLVPVAFILVLMFPMALLAQDTSDGVTMTEAIALVQAEYGTDVFIREVSYDAEGACWKFHLADGTEFCVDQLTGEFTFDDNSAEMTPEATSEATQDANDDCFDDDSDDDNSAEATQEADDDCDDDINDDHGGDDQGDDSDDDSDDDNSSNLTPVVTLDQAIAVALSIYPDGVVTDIELDDFGNDDLLVWDIELEGGRSVDVDAITGTILSFGYESDDDNSYADDNSDDSNDDSDDDNSGSGSDDSNDDSDDDDNSDDSNDDSDDDNSGSDDNSDNSDDD